MAINANENILNREYIYVRRLISVLTNDDSDKLILEKLEGKNLTSLLYNAKIIDNSKNMAVNKKILACVIRAVERERRLCRKKELEQSWGRKFLESFNCLYPGLKTEYEGQLKFTRGCVRKRKSSHKAIQHQPNCTKASSIRAPKTACRNRYKIKCESSVRCTKAANAEAEKIFKSKASSCVESLRNTLDSCVDSIVTDKAEADGHIDCWTLRQPLTISYKHQNTVYATICPELLRQKKLECVMVYPRRPLPLMSTVEKAEKKSSSTQTSGISCEPDVDLSKEPKNIKLQGLLEAALNLTNTRDQKEYVRTFLNNIEPPFDLSAGFPPYLKLPTKESDSPVGNETVYGSNSELSLRFDHQPQATKEDIVRRYVRDLVNEPRQDTAESIISGVIEESLPRDRADYSQLGARILKRLGAYPGSSYKDSGYRRQNLNIPEIILQCTEFFETDTDDSDKKSELSNGKSKTEQAKDSKQDESPSIIEMKLSDERNGATRDDHCIVNYCYLDCEISQKAGLLNLSESSLVNEGECQGKNDAATQQKVLQDRNNLLLREPLKITPSGLEQVGKKPKKPGVVDRKYENRNAEVSETRRLPMQEKHMSHCQDEDSRKAGKRARHKVSIYTVTSDKAREHCEGSKDHVKESATIENISILKSDSVLTSAESQVDKNININLDGKRCQTHSQVPADNSAIIESVSILKSGSALMISAESQMDINADVDGKAFQPHSKVPADNSSTIESVSILKSESALMLTAERQMDGNINADVDGKACQPQNKVPAGITASETPPELDSLPQAAIETFDGVGEGRKTSTDLPATEPHKKILPIKNRTFQEQPRSKKKCKPVSKKKTPSDKNGEGNCRVM